MKFIKFDEKDLTSHPKYDRTDYVCADPKGGLFVCRWSKMWRTDKEVLYYCKIPNLPKEFVRPFGVPIYEL